MEDKINNGVLQDLSSFLLVEGTADSDQAADYGHLKLCHDMAMSLDDDDDAESCSCDTRDTLVSHEAVDISDDKQGCRGQTIDHSHKNVRPQPSWRSRCKMWLRDSGLEYFFVSDEEAEVESKAGINLGREAMDQMEDRLFWETCMAVGYP